jgi:hypothetical protein
MVELQGLVIRKSDNFIQRIVIFSTVVKIQYKTAQVYSELDGSTGRVVLGSMKK